MNYLIIQIWAQNMLGTLCQNTMPTTVGCVPIPPSVYLKRFVSSINKSVGIKIVILVSILFIYFFNFLPVLFWCFLIFWNNSKVYFIFRLIT